jgi:hypothetical protein
MLAAFPAYAVQQSVRMLRAMATNFAACVLTDQAHAIGLSRATPAGWTRATGRQWLHHQFGVSRDFT